MIWVKSFAVGLLAVVIAIPIGILILGYVLKAKSGMSTVNFDIIAISRNVGVILTFLLVFLLGFYWEYHRLSSR